MERNIGKNLYTRNLAGRFSTARGVRRRHVIQGAAVVVTLGSRPAWSQDGVCEQLISASTMASFTGGSLSPGQEDLLQDLERAQRDASTQVTTNPDGSVCIAPADPQQALEAELWQDRSRRQREWLR